MTVGDWAVLHDGRGAVQDGKDHWRGFRCLACLQAAGLCLPERQVPLETVMVEVDRVLRWGKDPLFGCDDPFGHIKLRVQQCSSGR